MTQEWVQALIVIGALIGFPVLGTYIMFLISRRDWVRMKRLSLGQLYALRDGRARLKDFFKKEERKKKK